MRKVVFLFVLLITVSVFAQQEPNLSRYKTTNEKLKSWLQYTSEVLNTEDYPKLIIAAQKGIELSKNHLAYKSRFYFLKGNAYEFNNNQNKNAMVNYELALHYAKKARHLKNETSSLMRLSYAYYALNESSKRKQLIAYIKQVLDTTKSTYTKSVLYGSLGEYYLDNAQYETFIRYQLKAINYKKLLKKSIANNETIGVSYSQIAAAYTKMKQYDKAIEYLNYSKPYIKTSP
jgi:tetratricopeptide (TPR) repeat protein